MTLMETHAIRVAEAKYGKLELLAAAFISETGYAPSECELVEDHRDGVIRFYFRRKACRRGSRGKSRRP